MMAKRKPGAWRFLRVHSVSQLPSGAWRAWLDFDTELGIQREEVWLRESGVTGWIAEYNGFWKKGATREEAARRLGATVAAKKSLTSIERARMSLEPHAAPALAKTYRKRRALSGRFPVRTVAEKTASYVSDMDEAMAFAKDRAAYHSEPFVIAEDMKTGEYRVGTAEGWKAGKWKHPHLRRRRTVKPPATKRQQKTQASDQKRSLNAALRRDR